MPNSRKHNELEEKLEKPKPFASYCYDKICDTDIESAKALGIGIIVVDTRCYSVDRNKRLSQYATIQDDREKYSFVKAYDNDERAER